MESKNVMVSKELFQRSQNDMAKPGEVGGTKIIRERDRLRGRKKSNKEVLRREVQKKKIRKKKQQPIPITALRYYHYRYHCATIADTDFNSGIYNNYDIEFDTTSNTVQHSGKTADTNTDPGICVDTNIYYETISHAVNHFGSTADPNTTLASTLISTPTLNQHSNIVNYSGKIDVATNNPGTRDVDADTYFETIIDTYKRYGTTEHTFVYLLWHNCRYLYTWNHCRYLYTKPGTGDNIHI
ncbi:hypothetical protein SK128_015613 [Halocaridina rubra]|uniref:Uncharacterized protein n=1 Tax=Halocaridina rubra TaxID=373956 RepID=A0AAN8WG07_HALRR